MDNLSRIGIFIEVVKQESFAKAARELGITSSAVSKQIQNLEQDLKVKLLNRTTRKVSVTEEGALFFGRASHALEDIREATEQMNELKATPRGTLRISVPYTFGTLFLTTPIAEFAERYPEVQLDVQFDDRLVDMTEEGFDLILRIGALKDSSLIARQLVPCPFYVCASPAYLKKYGMPKTPDDLAQHNVLAYTRNRGAHEWRYTDADGHERVIPLKANFKCDTAEMMVAMAKRGLGIIISPMFFVQDEIENGGLKIILADYKTAPERSLYAMFSPNRYLSTRLRLFIDHIAAFCANRFDPKRCTEHIDALIKKGTT